MQIIEKVTEYLKNLVESGVSNPADRGYDYAMALCWEEAFTVDTAPTHPELMEHAASVLARATVKAGISLSQHRTASDLTVISAEQAIQRYGTTGVQKLLSDGLLERCEGYMLKPAISQ